MRLSLPYYRSSAPTERVSVQDVVVQRLNKLDTTPIADVPAEALVEARAQFNYLIQAERLNQTLDEASRYFATLRDTDFSPEEYRMALKLQLRTATELYDTLRRVNRTFVHRPDGMFVRVIFIQEMDDLYEQICGLRRDPERSLRFQDA